MEIEHQTKEATRSWREFLAHEMFEYFLNFAFLAVFLVAFAWYRRLILAAYHIQYAGYWMPLIEAAILAKVIMVGDALHLGRRFRDRPLVLITVYRTIVFTLFTALFSIVEHIVESVMRGGTVSEGISAIANKGSNEVLGSCVMIFVAFLPFFAMKEIERVFGVEKVRGMFFGRNVGNGVSSSTDSH